MSTRLQHYLDLADKFLEHCRQHLQREELQTLARRLASTPVEQGAKVREPWTHRMYVDYHWRRMSPQERREFLHEQHLASSRRKRQEVAP